MDEYAVKLTPHALRDLDGIYAYIADTLLESGTAEALVDRLEESILSLEKMPYRCPERRRGAYANKGYRNLFIENYTAVYRVDEAILFSILWGRISMLRLTLQEGGR